ncbi:hypothetical protein H1C71_030326, partial [Ictidomys tridecemlineatus]
DAPTSNSDSSPIPAEKIPKKVRSTSQPQSFCEIQNLDLIDFTPGPVSNYFTPLPEELLHFQYRDETTEEERQWERFLERAIHYCYLQLPYCARNHQNKW